MNSEAYFNELCLNHSPDDFEILIHLKECYQKLRQVNCTVCRVGYEDHTKLVEYIRLLSKGKRDVINFMYSFFKSPYEEDQLEEAVIKNYTRHEVEYNGAAAAGMTWALIKNTLTLSLLTNDEWDRPAIEAESDSEPVTIHHVSRSSHVDENASWLQEQQPVELIVSDLLPEEKPFDARDDHGKHELLEFWNTVKRNPYVVEMINSLPYNPEERRFVRKAGPDGKIELVLHWYDKGYGLIIQTTGRNIRETEKIAEILRQKYDQ